MIDVFAAAAGTGWEGQAMNGAALRHALAITLHPELAPLMQGLIYGWWRHGAVDYLSTTSADARDPDATGCGLLFLAYLHDGLGHAWPAIVRTGGRPSPAPMRPSRAWTLATPTPPSRKPWPRMSTASGGWCFRRTGTPGA